MASTHLETAHSRGCVRAACVQQVGEDELRIGPLGSRRLCPGRPRPSTLRSCSAPVLAAEKARLVIVRTHGDLLLRDKVARKV